MSDHISGPQALAQPAADITDFYAFASPERPGHLSLVLNTRPFAETSHPFSDALIYRFRLRPLIVGQTASLVPFAVKREEFVFDCFVRGAKVRRNHARPGGQVSNSYR